MYNFPFAYINQLKPDFNPDIYVLEGEPLIFVILCMLLFTIYHSSPTFDDSLVTRWVLNECQSSEG